MKDKNGVNKLETRTLYSALRPPRVALFVDTQDDNWRRTLLHIFDILPAIWGGDGFILIPSDSKSIHPFFKELLRIYDPDFIMTYQRTGYDLKIDNPKLFKKYVDSYVKIFQRQNPAYKGKDLKEIRQDYEKQVFRSTLGRNYDLEKDLQKFILKDLAIFHYDANDIKEVSLDYSGTTPHLLPKLIDVVCASDRLKNLKIVELNLDNHAIDFQLMGYGAAGRAGILIKHLVEKRQELEKLVPRLRKHAPDEVQETEQMIQRLQWVLLTQTERFKRSDTSVMLKSFWNRKVDLEGIQFREMWRALANKNKKTKGSNAYDFFTRVPFRASTLGLSFYFRHKDYLKNELDNPLLIIGDSIEDFCLYYSLTRLRNKVYWLPYKRLLADSKKPNASTYSFFLVNEMRSEGQHAEDKNIHWASISLKDKQIKQVPELLDKSELVKSQHFGNAKDHLVYINNPKLLLSYVFRLFEKGNANNRTAYQFIDDKGVNFVDTPRPKSFDATDPIKHKWIAEISLADYIYPTADFLSYNLFAPEGVNTMHLSTTATRVSHTGIHYQCPAMGFITSSDEVTDKLVKPKMNKISAQTIFEGTFIRKKYDIRPSDKGGYFLQVLDHLGGLDKLTPLIKNMDAFDLFGLYCDSTNHPNVYNRGAYLPSDKRRYINFESINALLEPKYTQNSRTETAKLIEYLSSLGLIERGYVLKCLFCKSSAWYTPADTDNGFICKRCGSQNSIKQETLRLQDPNLRFEPVVFYKLNELFYQFWNNNGWITALTLAKLKEKSEGSLIFIPETEFRTDPNQERPDFELDLLAVVDGNFYFGEAKKDANSQSPANKLTIAQIDRILGFDEFLPLKGLVFTSWSGQWPANVISKFNDIETVSQYELIKFSANDLL